MRIRATYFFVLLTLGTADADPLGAVRLEDLSATRERPLFRPSRRPPSPAPVALPAPPPAPVEVAPAAFTPAPFDLVGSVVGKNEAIVLLRSRVRGEILRLRQGEEAEGWRAVSIGLRSVTLEHEGRAESLALMPPAASPTTAQIAGEPQTGEADDKPLAASLKRVVGHVTPEN